jgi:hypothetical protein
VSYCCCWAGADRVLPHVARLDVTSGQTIAFGSSLPWNAGVD